MLWAIARQYISALWAEIRTEPMLAPNFLLMAENTDSTIALRWYLRSLNFFAAV
jgi:hypothetical protein